MASQVATTDQETRQRLLDAAARLFAERGFNKVSIRDICTEAGANIAAVNYYFRDKWGLYKEVLQVLIDYSNRTRELAHDASAGQPPEERLRRYIHVFLQRALCGGLQESWQGKLIAREMSEPSPGLDLFFEEVIRPNSVRVAALVSEIMGLPAADPRVGACVGSIQTQMVGLMNPIAARFVPGLGTPEVTDAIADHIAEFSLAGMRAIAQKKVEVKR